MKNIKDYKDTKTVAYCETKEEWDKLIELGNIQLKFSTFKSHPNICINIGSLKYRQDLSYYRKEGYTIIPASEFLTNKNNYYFY